MSRIHEALKRAEQERAASQGNRTDASPVMDLPTPPPNPAAADVARRATAALDLAIVGEAMRSRAMQTAREAYDSPAMRAAREAYDSPAMTAPTNPPVELMPSQSARSVSGFLAMASG